MSRSQLIRYRKNLIKTLQKEIEFLKNFQFDSLYRIIIPKTNRNNDTFFQEYIVKPIRFTKENQITFHVLAGTWDDYQNILIQETPSLYLSISKLFIPGARIEKVNVKDLPMYLHLKKTGLFDKYLKEGK